MKTDLKSAEIVMPCTNLDATLSFFVDRLNFRVVSIFPADSPREAAISAYGLSIRLVLSESKDSEGVKIRLNCNSKDLIDDDEKFLIAPNGVSIEFANSDPPVKVPSLKSSLVINKHSEKADWIEGRAGMRYRDLIPDRLGGYLIASHIHIPDAGPVPDYVHFHKVQFQMIYCYKGWVKVVYEDQGQPFVLNEGDCVLQPPEIRHRVLESSENLEVIELSIPAEHFTYADHEMTLPNVKINREREFNGQKFVRHVAKEAVWKKWRVDGFEYRDTGIQKATKGFANVGVIRTDSTGEHESLTQDEGFLFMFVLEGSLLLKGESDNREQLTAGDSFVIPGGMKFVFSEYSRNLEILEFIQFDY